MTAASQLRRLLTTGRSVLAPGAYDGLTARLVERAGFQAVYASGGAISRSTGIPDLGLLSATEMVERIGTMVDAVRIPLIADADTGYGNALNTQRTVRALARAGVAAYHLEDQRFPKRCGHYDDKSLVDIREMQQKIRAAKEAGIDPDILLIARTDALAVEGFDRAIERAQAYAEAGADVLFVEAPTSVAEIERIARELPQPKLINMFQGGKTPLMPADELARLGYGITIIPSDLQRAAIHACEITLAAIARDGHSQAVADRMVSFSEREVIIDTAAYLDRDRRYAS